MKRYTRSGAAVAALCAGVLAFAGCSAKAEDNSGSSGGGKNENTSGLENTSGDEMTKNIEEAEGVEGAKKLVEMWTSPPTSVGVTEPIKGKIPTGKKIAFMNCGVEICIANGNAVKEAAEILGWSVELINVGATPDDINASWNRVAAGDYDGVIASGLPSALFADALKKLQAKKVPVVECCVTAASSEGITALVGDSTTMPTGRQYAAWVTADTDGKANALWVGSADFPVIAELEASFKDGMTSWCPDCKTATLDIPAAEIGTTMPTKIASYVKSHPDVNYIALGYDGFATGLTQALTDAGVVDKVKFVGDDALPSNKQAVVDGSQAASIAFPIYEEMYAAVDALARSYAGESVEPSTAMMPLYIYTQENMVDPTKFEPLVEDYQEQFKALWGK